ncbi:MAG TPA: DUF4142 domain-containing protein [Chthoniobacterales bacterium]|nr:DUF4142 domain-containing protein [Chthoniobacterales bacterium]
MKRTLLITALMVTALGVPWQASFAADETATATATEKTFIMKAANGGMTEVELGKIAAEKGGSDEVKDFGNQMVKDHSKANDDLKEVAGKMGVEVPAALNAEHKATVDKFSGMTAGAAFDKAYVHEMIKDHEKDIAEFQAAQKKVKNADLKSFIEKTIPVMQEHFDMIKKFDQAKK